MNPLPPVRPARPGLSIVCVFNDPDVRRECLDRSIEQYAGLVDIDYIPVDNTGHAFTTAGGALNHGARLARHEVVAFAHQDVFLHSIDRLVVAASALGSRWGVLGANGVRSDGENVGRIRDRTQVLGRRALLPVEVDSVDEVLFLVRRTVVLEHPLSEDPDLAWHAYAVEYGLRLRALGLQPGAIDLGVTHNSLTTNLARLDVAHRRVGELYPERSPVRTTCGTIGTTPRSRWRDRAVVRSHGWRLRWLRHSVTAARARRRLPVPVVLSDIRHHVDLLPFSASSPLHLFNLDRGGAFAEFAAEPLRLTRFGRPVVMHALSTTEAISDRIRDLPPRSLILVVGIGLDDVTELGRRHPEREWVIGLHPDTVWLLARNAEPLPPSWAEPAAVPLALPPRARVA